MKKQAILLIALYILTVFAPTASAQTELINVALHQSTKASSQLDAEHSSEMAADGINDNESYTSWKSAAEDTLPWWQVDLNLEYEICRIEIEAAAGEITEEERRNFKVLGSADKDFTKSVVLTPEVTEVYDGVFSANISVAEKVRYVRVEKTKEGALSAGEIRVYIMRDTGENISDEAVTQISPVIAESDSSQVPSDVIGTIYEKDVTLLSALGIMRGYEDGLFLPDRQISRAEFAKIATKLIGNLFDTDETTFLDVSNGHWAHPYVETAVREQLINGVGGGYFMPDDAITTPQVIKILVSVLGYSDVAERKGGYPSGYNIVASEIDLYDDIKVSGNQVITRGEVARLVVNALECDKLEVVGVADDAIAGKVTDGVTLMMKNLRVAKETGIVTAVNGVSLTEDAPAGRDGTIRIDEKDYITELEGLNVYLGYSVDFYYDMDDTSRIVAVTAGNRNDVLTIAAEELLGINDRVLSYGTDKEKSISLSKQIDVLYNDCALRDYTASELLPEMGYVKLIDNNGDSEYDVYFVCDIKHHIVSWVNSLNETIYVEDNDPIMMDSDSALVQIVKKSFVDNNVSSVITLEDIKENDVLSVMISKNNKGEKSYSIVVCDDVIEGILTEVGDDTISINDNTYDFSKSLDTSELSVGSQYVFRLSSEGEIVAVDSIKEESNLYGYLIAVNEKTGIDKKIQFKIFTQNGEIAVFDAVEKDKLYIDGATYTDIESMTNHLLTSGRASGKLHQVVKYGLNSKNEVKKLDTVSVGDEIDSLSKDYESGTRYYKSTGVIGMQFVADENTIIFKVPDDVSREKDFEILSNASLSHNSQYTMEAYDCGEEQIAGLLLFSGSTSSATASAMLCMVDKIVTVATEDGETLNKLYGLHKGASVTYVEYEEGVLDVSELKRGDIIGLTLSGKDEIKEYSKKFYFGDKPEDADTRSISENSPQYGNPYSTIYYGYGIVKTKEDGMISIEYANSDSAEYKSMVVNVNDKNLSIYYYDTERDKVMLGNADYILDAQTVGESEASHVMINVDSGDVKELIIFD